MENEKKKTESWSVQADKETKERANRILKEFKTSEDQTNKTAFIEMLNFVEFKISLPQRNNELMEELEQLEQALHEVRIRAQNVVEKQDMQQKEKDRRISELETENAKLNAQLSGPNKKKTNQKNNQKKLEGEYQQQTISEFIHWEK